MLFVGVMVRDGAFRSHNLALLYFHFDMIGDLSNNSIALLLRSVCAYSLRMIVVMIVS